MKQAGLNRKSIFIKIMIVYVAAMLILYVFSLYIYNSSLNAQKDKLTQQVVTSEKQFIENLEQDVARIKTATIKAVLMPDWGVVSFHQGLIHDYAFLQNVLRAKERLAAIRNISPIIYDVYAYFPKWGRTLSSLGGLDDFDADAFNSIIMPLDATGAQFVYYKDEIYLTSAYRFKTPDNFSIVIRLYRQSIDKELKKIGTTETGITYLIRNETGEVMSPSGIAPAEVTREINPDPLHPSGTVQATIGGKQYICVYDYSSYLGFTVMNLLPAADLYKPLQIYYVIFLIFTVIVLLTIASIVYYYYRIVGKPMNRLMRAFESMEKGDFGVRLVPDVQDEFAYLYTAFDHMAENTQHLISEVYEKELLVERARLKHLQAQINPHFLYNSFYTLHRMIKIGDAENSEVFSAKLGKYFQYITRDAQDVVPLKVETDHAVTYAQIMVARYGGAVEIEMGPLPPSWENLLVPRLILQPLIENTFEHGMKQRTGRGFMKVSFEEDGDKLSIFVDDNGNGMEDEELESLNRRMESAQVVSEVTGLANINRRVQITFGNGSGLQVSKSKLGGTRVMLALCRTERKE